MIVNVPSYKIVGGKLASGARSMAYPYAFVESSSSEPVIDPVTSAISIDDETGEIFLVELGSVRYWSNYSSSSYLGALMFQPNTNFAGAVLAPYNQVNTGFSGFAVGTGLPNSGTVSINNGFGIGLYPIPLGPSKACSPVYGYFEGEPFYGVIYSSTADFSTIEGFAFVSILDDDKLTAIFENINAVEIKKDVPVNFYRTQNGEYTGEPIELKRGESSEELTFDIVFETGAVPYTEEVLFESIYKDKYFTVENNIITVLDKARISEISIIAKPAEYPDLITYITLIITDPLAPYDEGGYSGPAGGDGSFSGPGGSWGNGIGPAPSTDVTGDVPDGSAESNSSSTGLFTRYAVNNSELRSVGFALYAETILAQATKAVMSFLWNSPSEALISLISYPFDVASLLSTTPSSVKFGAIDLEAVTASRLNATFAQINWGTIQLSEYWGNFLDYAPHTKIELYLPWCTGSVSIDPHEVLPGSISVITNIEISKGTCIHNVLGNKGALIGTYSGTCGSQLPMTALDTSGKALALVTAAAGALVAGAAAGGGLSAGIAAANSPHTTAMAYSLENSRGLEPMAARLTAQKEAITKAEAPYRAIEKRATQAALVSSVAAFRTPATIQRNGSFTGNGAGMSIQFPFIIVSRPEQNIPDNYGKFYGYPSNVYARIGSVRGYTEIGSVHVNGLTGATLDEVEEVERLLKGGVIL